MARRRIQKRRGLGVRVAEMFGKDDTQGNAYGTLRTLWSGFFKHKTTIDYKRNNYELFKTLYYASATEPLEDESILLGAAFAKPIVNSTVAFSLGQGFQLSIAGADEEGAEDLKAVEAEIQTWIDKNFTQIYDWAKYANRDGDGYLFIDELGRVSPLRPETVDVVVNAVTGETIGYNVTDNVQELNPTTGDKVDWTYLRQYRFNYVRISRWQKNQSQKDAQILFERIFTTNGGDIDTQLKNEDGTPVNGDLNFLPEELEDRPLPIIHFRNEPEPGALYGNSELQNVLVYFRNYGEVLDEATKREVYNSKPVLVIKGIGSPEDDEANADAYVEDKETGEKVLDWQQRTTLYIEDPQGDAKFLEIPNTMDNTGKLLEYLFYCIVQASETPEFVFGTAVSSSRASVSEQMPIVAMKAERKRQQMRNPILDLINLHIYRELQLSNPVYFALQNIDQQVDIAFPAIIDEDKKLNREIIELLLTEGIVTGEKALETLLGMTSEEATDEIKKAMADSTARLAATTTDNPQDRLNRELNGDDEAEE